MLRVPCVCHGHSTSYFDQVYVMCLKVICENGYPTGQRGSNLFSTLQVEWTSWNVHVTRFLKVLKHVSGSPFLSREGPQKPFPIRFWLIFQDCLPIISSRVKTPALTNTLLSLPDTSLFSRSPCLCKAGFLDVEFNSSSHFFIRKTVLFQLG